MENLEISHDILVSGPDFESCRKRVSRFFERTTLVSYDEILVLEKESLNGGERDFQSRLRKSIMANLVVVDEQLHNLRVEGFTKLDEIKGVEKGYVSKLFHTIAHLLDGFIGIDSRFYNLEEDSHGVSRDLQRKVQAAPDNYWIIRVKGRISPAGEDPLDALRTFEWKGKDND